MYLGSKCGIDAHWYGRESGMGTRLILLGNTITTTAFLLSFSKFSWMWGSYFFLTHPWRVLVKLFPIGHVWFCWFHYIIVWDKGVLIGFMPPTISLSFFCSRIAFLYFKRLFPCHETLKRFLALIEKVPFVSYIAFHLPKRVSFAFVTLPNFEKKKLILKNLFSSFCRATADGSYDCFFS
jgi:hypothetical protein